MQLKKMLYKKVLATRTDSELPLENAVEGYATERINASNTQRNTRKVLKSMLL